VIFKGPPVAATVTVAVAVFEPAPFIAVSVYFVVADGLTVVEPLALDEVNVPGVMPMLVAPDVVQLKVLVWLELMFVGSAVNELIVGTLAAVNVTVAVAVTEPAAFVAVRTYVVVTSGLSPVEPDAEVDAYVPGVMVMVVAPVVAQLSVLMPPKLMLVGLAVNELIVGRLGAETFTVTVAVVEPVVFVAVRV
jgi:hypothetical protein